MNENKPFLIVTFLLGGVLLLVAALFYSMRQTPEPATETSRASVPTRYLPSAGDRTLEQLKTEEFLEEDQAASSVSSLARTAAQIRRTGGVSVGGNYQPRAAETHPLRRESKDTLFTPSSPTDSIAPARQKVSSGAGNAYGKNNPARLGSGAVGRGYAMGGQALSGGADTTEQEKKSAAAFAPYLSDYTKKQAEKLEKKLAQLPGIIDAAVRRAFLPKSKKVSNIEKYLPHRDTNAPTEQTSNDPFATVNKQFARQKNSLVNTMKKTYGDKAAQRAGRLMDSYQKELFQALSQPGLTPEQIQQKTQQISDKYNKKLEKLNEQSAREYAERQLTEKTQSLQTELAKVYGDEIAGQLGEISAQYDQKALALSHENLAEEEYLKQYFDNEHQRRKALEKALLDNGQSLKGLNKWDDSQEQKWIDELKKAEEEGKPIPIVRQESDEQKEQRRAEQLDTAKQIYGAEGAALVKQVYENYDRKEKEIAQNKDLSPSEKAELLQQERQKVNQELERVLQDPRMRQAQLDNQVHQVMKDPAVRNRVPEEQVREILQDMNERVNQINEDKTLSDEKKEEKRKQAQALAQEQLNAAIQAASGHE